MITNVYFQVGDVEYVLDYVPPHEFESLIESMSERQKSVVAYPTIYTIFGGEIVVWPMPPDDVKLIAN